MASSCVSKHVAVGSPGKKGPPRIEKTTYEEDPSQRQSGARGGQGENPSRHLHSLHQIPLIGIFEADSNRADAAIHPHNSFLTGTHHQPEQDRLEILSH